MDTAPVIVNKRELARAAAVSEPTVDRWIADGCPVIRGGSNGVPYQFDLREVLDWRRAIEAEAEAEAERRQGEIRQLELEITGGAAAESDAVQLSAKDRSAVYDAELKSIRLRREMGELLTLDEVERDYAAMLGLLRLRLLALPHSLARQAHLPPATVKIVQAEIHQLMRELKAQIKDPALRPPESADRAA